MNRAVPDEIVDQIRMRADIVDVIQSYLPLKKAGVNFKACCPFHQEKTPSFTVNPNRQSFHCFGCGKGGDVFKFVMERENVDFPNALHILAARYGIRIPERNEGQRSTPVAPEERPDFKERLYSLHEKIRDWFVRNLKNNPETPVAKYLATRGLPEEAILKFGIGASVDSWDAGASWARREGFSDKELSAGGLLVESSEHPGRFYDRFRNRLMFPIWNEQGRVVGFSARTIEKEAHGGKYVNSPETPIFKKSRILYGLHLARTPIGKAGFAILCEGQLDVIAMHRADFQNAVAPQGTAFTEEQASILKRYTDTLLLGMDSDAAGQKALLRCAEIALPAGFTVKIIQFPAGKDPDELLKTLGPQAIAGAVNTAQDFFEFLYAKLAKDSDLSNPANKAKAAAELVRFVNLLEGELPRATYTEWLANKLGMDQAAISGSMRKLNVPTHRNRIQEEAIEAAKRKREKERRAANTQMSQALASLLECMLLDKESAKKALGQLGEAVLEDSPLGKAVETVIQATMNDEWEDAPKQIVAGIDKSADCPQLTAILAAEPKNLASHILEKTVDDCLRLLMIDQAKRRAAELLVEYQKAADGPDRDSLIQERAEALRIVAHLNARKPVKDAGKLAAHPRREEAKPKETPPPPATPAPTPTTPPDLPEEIVFEEESSDAERPPEDL